MPYFLPYIAILKLIHMSTEEQVSAKILSAGPLGIKKAELRKIFAGIDLEELLNELVTSGDVVIEKKGTTYYCWHKQNYLQSLLNSDPKFRLIYESLRSLENSMTKSTFHNPIPDDTTKTEILSNEPISTDYSGNSPYSDSSEFVKEFDKSIAENSNSIGWVELEKVRKDLSNKHIYQQEDFYNQVKLLVESNTDKYELSTGGNDGVMIRGMLHGFVRCI
jgi:hypothetical protein